jgi:hypothetical protein
MAAGSYEPIRPFGAQVYSRGTISLPEKASQTFKVGAPLVLNGGYLEEAGTAPATIFAIAAENGHNGGSDGTYSCTAYRLAAGDQYAVSMEDAYAVADHGGVYGLVKDATSGYWFLDDADAGDQCVVLRVDSTPSLGAVGDTKWRAIVEFQTANIAGA